MDILTGSNQVINPEYVTPLDSKESPLSLLAKTCSSIGMDQPSRVTSSSHTNGKASKEGNKSTSPASTPGSTTSSRHSSSAAAASNGKRSSPSTSTSSKVSFKPYESVTGGKSDREKSRSPSSKTAVSPAAASTAAVTSSSGVTVTSSAGDAALRELALGAAFKSPPYLSPYGLPSPLDALYLRAGLPPAGLTPSPCRDPLCKGCTPGLCPAGCLHCKSLSPPGGASVLGLPASMYPPPGLIGGLQPYICNWSESGAYCGKRFNTSDELMTHLRTHTNLSASDASLPVLPSLQHLMALPRSPFPPPPPLSPLSAARYHPYSKPPSLGSLSSPPAASPFSLYPYLANPYLYGGLRR